jgi:prepilin signal peptidase PulO-like enzyme (type II secretory pathway)
VRKRHGLGFGDIALMAMSGAFLGLKLVILVIVCAPLLAVVYAIFLLIGEAIRPGSAAANANAASETASALEGAEDESGPTPFLQRAIPFGVFLGGCSLLAIFFGESVWAWYLGKLIPR